ncbi:hypothetical protein U717_16115 [Rhodobacter capsulatus R121]|nr:hypothetical protein U714_16150 [Rhodobacter capsulatus DE442]ETD74879.1 hypothetical protein U717_16115 [Rhodobacter capsulatus R121]ETE52619.1 hypothetical protein U715_16105 [Rhodobacter capsulatus Y262]
MPPPPTPKPAHPTAALTVDGIEIRPAERLAALAKIRDRHRSTARFASDQMHALREKIEERRVRVRLISERIDIAGDFRAEGEISQINAEIDQLMAAREAAVAEAETASDAAAQADRLLRSALRFALDHGATVPITLAGEVR